MNVKGGVTLADGTYFDFPNVGNGVVYYADDNRGTGEPDVQGGIFTGEEWGNTVQSCEERPDPWIYDALTGGNLKVG